MAPKQATYNVKAPKQTVRLTTNSDLYTQAKGRGLRTSALEGRLARSSTGCKTSRFFSATVRVPSVAQRVELPQTATG